MATAIPGMKGRFGSYEYYLTTMHVGELVQKVTIPKDLPDWEEITIEERYQRDINLTRVKKYIAPYFAGDENRFSNAIILAVLHDEGMEFEPLSRHLQTNKLLSLYRSAAKNLGFITFSGQEVLVPLDGQHRVKAFDFAMSGTDERNMEIPGITSNTALAQEDVAVILVRFEADGARRIFNKINRYAKPTSKAEVLVVDDDDQLAVLTRNMIGDEGVFPAGLVRHKSNTLNAKAREFTTLPTLYEANGVIAREILSCKSPESVTDKQREVLLRQIMSVWLDLSTDVNLFARALQDPSSAGDLARTTIRRETLLGKPIGQLALVRGYAALRERCPDVEEQELRRRLNLINWNIGWDGWIGVLMRDGAKVLSGKTAVNTAANMIAYLAGGRFMEDELRALAKVIAGEEGAAAYQFPERVV